VEKRKKGGGRAHLKKDAKRIPGKSGKKKIFPLQEALKGVKFLPARPVF